MAKNHPLTAMNLTRLIALGALYFMITSCHTKEVFPDLAKQMQGDYSASDVTLSFYNPARNTGTYNPKDSAQIGQITISKIDALSVNVHLLLKKQNGEVIFEDAYDCELSRDINNKGQINFTGVGNRRGAYIIDNGQLGYNYINIGGYSTNKKQVNAVQAGFTARL
jgi:hypothetical protein